MIAQIRHFLFPHKSNNYKAHSLHLSSLAFYAVTLLLVQILVRNMRSAEPNVLGYAKDISVARILLLVNQKRSEAGAPPVALSEQLSSAASQKASDMFSHNYWAHISPTGTTPWEFIRGAGYDYQYAGENLAKSFDTSDAVVEAWMNSPTHKANLLKSEYKEMGLAIMNGSLVGEETTLVVQEFGSRAGSPEPVAEKSNLEDLPVARTNSGTSPQVLPSEQTLPLDQTGNKPLLKSISLYVTLFLLVVLFFDALYIWKVKPHRLSSRTLAHIIFLGALLGAIGATGVGAVL